MLVVRRRLIIWLIKAYIKKSKKILLISFFSGLLVFFAILLGSKYVKNLFTLNRLPVVGIVGSYRKENLPPIVLSKLSRGLTKVNSDKSISPDLATRYRISEKDKTYTFYLNDNIKFSDGSKLISTDILYNFSDVVIDKPDKNTIIFKLKNPYSPFLTTVSKPLFKKGYSGAGDYFILNIKFNGDFVQEATIGLRKNRFETIKYIFYPTEDALKTAFMLGEITQAEGLSDSVFKDIAFEDFPKTKVEKKISYSKLVALFYDTTDSTLSDRKIRLALSYAVPNTFNYGEKAYLPYSKNSLYYNTGIIERRKDVDHAKLLLPESKINLTISTLKKYKKTANEISESWEKIGIKTKIKEIDEIPDRFQIFLGDYSVPDDPDQYALWHSKQINNITKYKNLRIDKLLEDGRKTVNINERKKIYLDFQKYLLEDMPATFLYFPYEYRVIRN